jgi:hypothetical protein
VVSPISTDVFGYLARYTKFVFFGKWALGGVALLILVMLIAWPLFISGNAGMRISLSSQEANGMNSGAPVMQNPRYQGNSSDGQPYTVIAKRAIQQSDSVILLEKIKGDLSTKRQKWLSLTAENGRFEDTQKILILHDGVVMKHQDGHIVITDRAFVDTRQFIARGDKEVQMQSPIGSLLATGFEIRDNGDYMKFGTKGRVKVDIKKSRARAEKDAS